MDRSDELAQEVEALRDRLSGLSETSRRINEGLDYGMVLQGVLNQSQGEKRRRMG